VTRVTILLVVAGALAAGMAGAVSDAAAPKRTGTIAFIRFSSAKPGPFGGRLFVIRADGSELRPLTPPSTKVSGYAWSPDGTRIAYHDAQGSLWLVRPDGSGRRLLLSRSRMQTVDESWSPDGGRIAVTSLGPKVNRWKGCCTPYRLYVVSVAGSAPVFLPGGKHIDYRVSWSPRGDTIYYGNGGVWAIHPDGTGRRQVSPVGAAGSLSAGGAQLAFGVASRLRNGHTDRYAALGVVNADGTGYHVVTTHAYNEYGEAWSPSGRRILYGRADGVYVIGSDGRNNHRVTGDSPPEADWGALAWSPDGGSIVYDTGDYNNTDLYVIGVDGRRKVQLTNTPDLDIGPSWVAR
jgi:Tol biopolymer transport system component